MAGTARLWQEPSSSENLLVLSQGIATLNGHLLRARRKTKMEWLNTKRIWGGKLFQIHTVAKRAFNEIIWDKCFDTQEKSVTHNKIKKTHNKI
jgi:hypothetical protein